MEEVLHGSDVPGPIGPHGAFPVALELKAFDLRGGIETTMPARNADATVDGAVFGGKGADNQVVPLAGGRCDDLLP